jgi:hypothetical protein
MISISKAVLLILVLSLASVSARATYVGDDALTLTTTDFRRVDSALAESRINALLKALNIPWKDAAILPRAGMLELIKIDTAVELPECENKLIIAKGDVRVVESNGCILISGGAADFVHVERSIIVTQGGITVSGEGGFSRGVSGLYVTKGEFELARGRAPYIYAVGGHDPTAPRMTTYNTPLKRTSTTFPQATHNTIEPIFREEPRPDKKDIGKSFRLNASENIRYSGERCIASRPDHYVFWKLSPLVRERSACQEQMSATVTCLEGREVAEKNFVERWTFDACGRVVNVRFHGQRLNSGTSIGPTVNSESIIVEPESAATSRQ